MNPLLLSLSVAFLLAGCGSASKLDTVPVEDKLGIAVAQPGADGLGTTMLKGGVAVVDLGASSSAHATPPVEARVVYFDYDSYVIRPEFQPLIEVHARYLKAGNGRKAAIEGYTDERGGR